MKQTCGLSRDDSYPIPPKKTARTVVFRNGMIESVIYDFKLTSITVFLPEFIANSLPTYPNTKFLECPGELERPM